MGFVENITSAAHSIELVRTLIKNNSHLLNEHDKDGNTAVFWACREGKPAIVKLLIEAKTDLNKANKKEETPLTVASSDGQYTIVQYLVEGLADVDKPNKNGWTPLICAAYNGHLKTVELLLDSDADIDAVSNVGCTALYWACNNDQLDMVSILLERGADVDKPNNVKKTPLMIAARWGRNDIIEVLLKYKAKRELLDDDGVSASDFALQYQHSSTAELITSFVYKPTMSSSKDSSSSSSSKVATKGTKKSKKVSKTDKQQIKIIQDEAALSLQKLQQSQPVFSSIMSTSGKSNDSSVNNANNVMNSETIRNLKSLAEASPLVIEYLKGFGNAAYQAEQQFQLIMNDPSLLEYYVTFNKNVSGVVLASQSISSNMIADTRTSTGEQIVNLMNDAASATSVFALPVVTSLLAFLVKIPNDIDRVQTIKRITTCFPSIDSHKFIEMLAREVTTLLAGDIRAVLKLAKKHSKVSIFNMAIKAVEWLSTYDNATPIQAYATMHTGLLLNKLMYHEPSFTVQQSDLPTLIEWATGIKRDSTVQELEFPPPPTVTTTVPESRRDATNDDSNGISSLPPPPPHVEYADKELVDDRINKLMLKLELEEAARMKLEVQLKEVKDLSNKVEKLNALNEIFGNLDEGELTRAQNKQSIAAVIENHFKNATVTQNVTDETLRELVLQVQLIMESMGTSGSNSPVKDSSTTAHSITSSTCNDKPEVVNYRIDNADTQAPVTKKTVVVEDKVDSKGCGCVLM